MKVIAVAGWLAVACTPLAISGCATVVPDTRQFGTTKLDNELHKNALIDHIKCELRNAYTTIRFEDAVTNKFRKSPQRNLEWFDNWGATVSLKVVVAEHLGVAPALTFITPMRNVVRTFPTGGPVTSQQNSSLGFTAARTSDVTKTETIAFFVAFKDLVDEVSSNAIVIDASRKNGCRLSSEQMVDGDLKIYDFMEDNIFPARHGGVLDRPSTSPGAKPNTKETSPFSAFNYEVQFVVATSGGLNPSWKLVDLSANPTGPLLAVGRTRTNDLILTMGPMKADGPSQTVLNEQLAALIGRSVADNLRNGQH